MSSDKYELRYVRVKKVTPSLGCSAENCYHFSETSFQFDNPKDFLEFLKSESIHTIFDDNSSFNFIHLGRIFYINSGGYPNIEHLINGLSKGCTYLDFLNEIEKGGFDNYTTYRFAKIFRIHTMKDFQIAFDKGIFAKPLQEFAPGKKIEDLTNSEIERIQDWHNESFGNVPI